jgi:SAM-dependent methyltransferase
MGMSTSPLLDRLRAHAAAIATESTPAAETAAGEPQPAGAAPALATGAPPPARAAPVPQLGFWQSPVARAAINRRITGDPELAPETYFARRHGPSIVAPHAVSLRASDAKLEIALVEAGSCERLTGLDEEQARIDFAAGRVPEPLRERITFRLGTLERWEPPEPLGAAVLRSCLHRRADLEQVLDRLAAMLVPDGLLFVEDFVGPARFQWTDAQLDAINRLLARLPRELLQDLSAGDGRLKTKVERQQRGAGRDATAGRSGPAPRSDEIVPLLDRSFERVELRPFGGAIFHQLFGRIMGNFDDRPDLVGVLMEVDALLTDAGAVASDYMWGVWRRGRSAPRRSRWRSAGARR